MSEHTPGPWGTCTNSLNEWDVAADDGCGDMICDLRECNNARANALLIAAAPDLLAALIAVSDELRHHLEFEHGTVDPNAYPELFVAEAAIKKARGES